MQCKMILHMDILIFTKANIKVSFAVEGGGKILHLKDVEQNMSVRKT